MSLRKNMRWSKECNPIELFNKVQDIHMIPLSSAPNIPNYTYQYGAKHAYPSAQEMALVHDTEHHDTKAIFIMHSHTLAALSDTKTHLLAQSYNEDGQALMNISAHGTPIFLNLEI